LKIGIRKKAVRVKKRATQSNKKKNTDPTNTID